MVLSEEKNKVAKLCTAPWWVGGGGRVTVAGCGGASSRTRAGVGELSVLSVTARCPFQG